MSSGTLTNTPERNHPVLSARAAVQHSEEQPPTLAAVEMRTTSEQSTLPFGFTLPTMAPNGTCQPYIDMSNLADISKDQMDFLDTSFFQSNEFPRPQLPTPASIIQRYGDGGARVVKIEDLNIAVKINDASYLKLEEAQTMRARRQVFPNDEVPVPEVFGWRTHGEQIFIYMSLVKGKTLREAWPSLTKDEKRLIRDDLSRMIETLRSIPPNPSALIGSINGGTLQDRFFRLNYESGPFSTIKVFNDWLFAIATRQNPGRDEIRNHPDLYRDLLPDTGSVYFAHGDLTLGNITVSGAPGLQRIKAIIDWEQAGWYPEYWEYCKMLYGVELDHEWRTDDWPDKIVKPFEEIFLVFAEYMAWRPPY